MLSGSRTDKTDFHMILTSISMWKSCCDIFRRLFYPYTMLHTVFCLYTCLYLVVWYCYSRSVLH